MVRNQRAYRAEESLMTVTLLIRANANTAIGSGHVMRCLALAQAWQERGGHVTFVCGDDLPQALRTRLRDEGMSLELIDVVWGSRQDADYLIKIATELDVAAVVVDGYHFGADYQRWIKDAGLRLLFIDDNGHADHYYADWVLNQNIHANEALYASREAGTQLLLGTNYALLRREFWRWRGWKREVREVAQNILITMGGSDPDNVTLDVLHVIEALPDAASLHIKAIVGGNNPHQAELMAFADATSLRVDILHDVTDMPQLMAWADVAISAGGSTVWELCMMGVPSLLIVTADNQGALVRELETREILYSADIECLTTCLKNLIAERNKRLQMNIMANDIVDGFGVNRILMLLRGDRLWLREATAEDCELIWRWANDPVVRQASFSPDPISWDSHIVWFQNKLTDPNCTIYIASNALRPIGQIRFDLDDAQCAFIDYSLDVVHRGEGLGKHIINVGVRQYFADSMANSVHGIVRIENEASRRIFMATGFSVVDETSFQGFQCQHFIKRRNYD